MEESYNCWHGCHKKSEGCLNCYVYRFDKRIGKDSNTISKTKDFDKPIKRKRNGEYKYPSGTLFDTCFSSDFFIEEADEWRQDVLNMIKERKDCDFFLITKRPERIMDCLNPIDYPNLIIYCTMENQIRFDERAPIYLNLPLLHKGIIIEPMLGPIDLTKYLDKDIEKVSVGGESGPNARVLDFNWVKEIKRQCDRAHIPFNFRQTGANILVNNKLYHIPRDKQFIQAKKAFNNKSSF